MAKISETLALARQHHRAGRLQAAEQACRQVSEAEPSHPEALHLLGEISLQTGNHQQAVDLISRALAVRPDWAEAHFNLGNALRNQRRLNVAIDSYRRALKSKPDYIEAHFKLGITLKDQGYLRGAVVCYRQVLELRPDIAEAHNNLGNTLTLIGDLDEAVANYRRALELNPECADVHNNLGNALLEQGKLDEAAACCRRALKINPDFAAAHNNLGNAYSHLGNPDDAVVCCRRALELKPDYVEALYNLANALEDQGQLDDAIVYYRRALELHPDYADAHNNLGSALQDQTKLTEAIACYRQALELKPVFAGAHNNLGNALQDQGKLTEAIACYRRALGLDPVLADAHNNMGNAFRDQGQPNAAIVWYRKALELKPDSAAAHSNLLCTLQYCQSITPALLAEAHAEYDRQHAAPLRGDIAPHEIYRERQHRLRIGFVSPDLWRHPVGRFLVRVLENMNPERQHTICYSDRLVQDDLTHRLRAAATGWRDVAGQSDERLAEQIRGDQIDILFDLAGHTGRNRLLLFARKPAPIQITWIGYEGTTGLEAMDYLLADRHVVPEGSEAYYRERVLRMPDGYLCYDPLEQAPPAGLPPSRDRGWVTFGCFNNLAKITPAVVAVWAKILHRAPTARLILKYRGLGDPTVKERYLQLFSAVGVEPQRLDLQPWSSYADYLAAYQQVDLALDPFPFSGGTTTCESLWMEVPVITCPGATFASRHSLSHLSNVGLTETIAQDLDEYVELAVSLAGDLPRLARLRAGLRDRMAASPLCDGQRFAANLESLLQDVWGRRNPDAPVADNRRTLELDNAATNLNLGNAFGDRGNFDEAITRYRRALELEPDYAEAHSNLGNMLRQQGILDEAVISCRRALELQPDLVAARNNLGNALKDLGQVDEAIGCYRRALELDPGLAEVHNNLGTALLSQGNLDQAVASYRQALDLKPDYADACTNLGNALKQQGKLGEAVAACRRALELNPNSVQAHNNLGNALTDLGQRDEAITCYSRALELKPEFAEAHNNLGTALSSQGKPDEAVVCYQRALELNPDFAEAHNNLGNAWQFLAKLSSAVECYRRSLELNPDDANAHNNLGNAFRELGKLDEAVAACRHALELKPQFAEAHNNLGSALRSQGKLDEAVVCYRRALELKPDFAGAHSNLLYSLHYSDGITPAALAQAHAVYDRQHAAPLRGDIAPHENLPDRHRQLRVGFLSPNLGRHPVGYFLVRVLENMNPERQHTICYSDRLVQDDLTHRLRAAATGWRDVAGQSDERLAEQIRGDQIDILFDLAGHTGRNRLLLFARKPAPIQITWIGYEGTTGLEAMDYLLADRHVVPEGSEAYYRERVLRMPDGYLCYDPLEQAPPAGLPPSRDRGWVTFGCFNNLAKITPAVVAVWAKILHRAPTARLILKYRGLGDPTVKERYLQLFSAVGVEPQRLDLQPWSSYADYLAAYQQVDLALDPFPFSGGTTTCESLWMEVPVITCPGATFASRHSLSHLSNVGLTETIAQDLDEYVELAVSLAGDLPRLARLRAGLRDRMAASPLCDGQRFAANLESLLQDVWGRYVSEQFAGRRPHAEQACSELRGPTTPIETLLHPPIDEYGSPMIAPSLENRPTLREMLTVAIQEHKAGRLPAAEAGCHRILAVDPNHAGAWNLLGVIALRAGRRATALEYIRRAIRCNGHAASYRDNLAAVFRTLGRLDEAAQCYQRILEIDPTNNAARGKLQQVLDHQQANKTFCSGRPIGPIDVLDSWLAQAREIGIGQIDEEIRSFCEFIRDKRLNHVLEIGSHHGGTFFLWCRLATGKKISLDLVEGGFGGLGKDDAILRNESMRCWADGVYALLGDSHDPGMREQISRILEDDQLDLLFIDGDHTYEGVKADYEMYSNLVKPGGYIAFHDIIDSQIHRDRNCHVAKFWNELAGEKIEFNAHGDWAGIGVVRRPTS